MRIERLAIVFVFAVAAIAFLFPAFHMPEIPQVQPLTIKAPELGQGVAVEIGYMIISGVLAGFNPLLFMASVFLGLLLFVYNKSRIPQYTRYYIIGAVVVFFAFEYQMTLPEGIGASLFGFQMMMALAVLSLLLALVALEFSPGFAEQAAKSESVRISYFIFIGALVALVIVLYGNGAPATVIDFAAASGHGLIELLIYNLCAMVPSTALFAVLSMNRITFRSSLANNRESILIIGTVLLVVCVLVVELYSLLS